MIIIKKIEINLQSYDIAFAMDMIIFIIVSVLTLYVIPQPLIWLFEYMFPSIVFRCLNPLSSKKVVISIDDIPYRTSVEDYRDFTRLKKMVDLFNKYNYKAIFFVVGNDYNTVINLEKAQLVHAIKSGHMIANHGSSNICHAIRSDYILGNDILDCDELINKLYLAAHVSKPSTEYFRPGYRLFTLPMMKIVKSLGKVIMLGSVYPSDLLIRFPYINYLYIRYKIENKDIVIIHDRPWTISMLEYLLPYLKKNNFEVSLPD